MLFPAVPIYFPNLKFSLKGEWSVKTEPTAIDFTKEISWSL